MTELIKVDPKAPELDKLSYAAEAIRRGALVAFPTETVYGLGANALDKMAVLRIFKAKGRPLDNPIIVHIGRVEDIHLVAKDVPSTALELASRFWPGPLTLILRKSETVPKETCGGRETVAVRMPAHPIALMLVREAGVPVAAPSANLSGRPSPTSAKHVLEDLDGKIDIIIDGGRTAHGVESTVLDVSKRPPLILRPGPITLEVLSECLGKVDVHPNVLKSGFADVEALAPGMKYRHYAPKAQLVLFEGPKEKVVKAIQRKGLELSRKGKRVGIATTKEDEVFFKSFQVVKSFGSRRRLDVVAKNLYEVLREMDHKKVDVILCEGFEDKGLGLTIMNRLRKAAAGKVVKVR